MWQTWQHASKPCQLVFALDLSFHLVLVGFTILCSQCWMLTNLKASSVALIEIWGNCLFYMFRDTTFNFCGFGMLMWEQLYFIGYILISFIDYQYFQSWQTAQSLFPQIFWSMEKYSDGKIQKSEFKLRSSNVL